MRRRRRIGRAERRLLPEGRLAGPMPWVIAIMAFLAALALAGGVALRAASIGLGEGLARRLTVEVVTADPVARAAQAAAALAALRRIGGVEARPVPAAALEQLLAPWLGPKAGEAVPLPALIDVTLDGMVDSALIAQRLAAVAPAARIDRHDAVMAPLAGLVGTMRLIAGALVLLMAGAMAAVIALATKGALDTHRATVDTLHLLGAEDGRIARLFARRQALDALFGATIGAAAAIVALRALAGRLAALDSGVAALAAPGPAAWGAILLLPPAVALIAMAAAWATVGAKLKAMP